MDGAGNRQDPAPEFSRPPTLKDLIAICGWLNATHARYVVVGGMAMNFHGMVRGTHDIDLFVDTGAQNMVNVLDALSHLPDCAARQLRPEEIREYTVLRINGEVTVDLLGQARGVTCKEAFSDAAWVNPLESPFRTLQRRFSCAPRRRCEKRITSTACS